MFKFYLDNTLVSDPLNWDDFEEVIERDDSLKLLLPKYEVKLKFDGDGYKYIRDKYKENGFCYLVELRIEKKCDSNYSTILNGFIFISDCKFNLTRCIVECGVVDNNYTAKIFNNKNIKVNLDSTQTKNGETIVPPTPIGVQFFTPSTGIYSGSNRYVYNIIDAFTYLISFITDNTVGFESNYFTFSLNAGYIGIVAGEEIRLANGTAPYLSFQELFEELNKKIPIGMTVVDRNGVPTIKIENEGYFYTSNQSIEIDNIQDLEQSFDNEKLYSVVKFGEATSYNGAINSLGEIQFLTFKEEEYHIQGKCNIDKTLDLTAQILSNSNTIEELFATNTSNDSYDDSIFFIHYNSINKAIATANPTTLTTPNYYNAIFTNNNVAERYSLAGNIAYYLGNNDLGFMASSTSGTQTGVSVSSPPFTVGLQTATDLKVGFNNDSTSPNYDATANYSTATNRYTSPVSGDYIFETNLILDVNKGASTFMNYKFRVIVEFRKYNAANVLQQIYTNYFPSATGFYTTGPGIYQVQGSSLVYLNSTDYCEAWYHYEYEQINYTLSSSMRMDVRDYSYFKTLATTSGGGIYKPEDPRDYFVSLLSFDRAISENDYSTIKQDLSYSMKVENSRAWIRKIRRKLATSETTFELISNLDNSK